jgi:membrane-associated phospholipid phosphatase
VIAAFGDSLFYLIAFFLGMLAFKFIYKSNHYALVCLFFFLAIASSGLAADALKFILGRSRPNLLLKQNIYTFEPFQIERNMTSFPSGHAATITALVCALYCFFPKPKYLYIATAALVAGSRVLITAHYLSDVVFGAYVALLVTPFVKYRFEKEGGRIFTPSARQ